MEKDNSHITKNRHIFFKIMVHYDHWYINTNVVSFVMSKIIVL